MKVILLQDVARIGRRYEIKDVPTGHALNFLIPRKMAELATPENTKRIAAHKEKRSTDSASVLESFRQAIAILQEKTMEMPVEANEQGHFFKGIKADDIAVYLGEQGVMIPAEHIVLSAPIKEVGTHAIQFVCGDEQVTVPLTLIAK